MSEVLSASLVVTARISNFLVKKEQGAVYPIEDDPSQWSKEMNKRHRYLSGHYGIANCPDKTEQLS